MSDIEKPSPAISTGTTEQDSTSRLNRRELFSVGAASAVAAGLALAMPQKASAATSNSQFANVLDFGALGDSSQNDLGNIQSAINSLGSYGGEVYFPAGDYFIDAVSGSTSIEVPVGVSLRGPGTVDLRHPGTKGASIKVGPGIQQAILCARGTEMRGLNFYYPDQIGRSLPISKAPTIQFFYGIGSLPTELKVPGCDIVDCVFHNSYIAINLGFDSYMGSLDSVAGNTHIERCRIAAFYQGIVIGDNRVNLYLTDITISPEFCPDYWTGNTGLLASISRNAIAISYDNGSGIFVDNLGIFGYYQGIRVAGGAATFLQISNSIIDGTQQCISVGGDASIKGALFTGCSFLAWGGGGNSWISYDSSQGDYACVRIASSKASKVQFTGCYFGPSFQHHVVLLDATDNPQSQLFFTGCMFENAGMNEAGTSFNLYLRSVYSSVIINGCTFKNVNDGNTSTSVDCINTKLIKDLTVSGSQFRGAHRYALLISDDAVMAGGRVMVSDSWSRNTTAADALLVGSFLGDFVEHDNLWDTDPPGVIKPRFHVRKNSIASQSGIQSETSITFNEKIYDEGNNFSTLTSKFTAPVAGHYQLNTQITHDDTVTPGGRFLLRIYAGSQTYVKSFTIATATYDTIDFGVLTKLEENETAHVSIQLVGGNGSLSTFSAGNAVYTSFSGAFIE